MTLTLIKEKLSQKKVIDHERIKELRKDITFQYKDRTPREKANILAKAIHTIIDDSLPNLSIESKRSIRMTLLNEKLSANSSLNINGQDIFESSIELAIKEDLEDELLYWVKTEVDIEDSLVEAYVNSYKETKHELAATVNLVEDKLNFQVESVSNQQSIHQKKHLKFLVLGMMVASLILIPMILNMDHSIKIEEARVEMVDSEVTIHERTPNALPSYLQYHEVDIVKLQAWLDERDSILVEEPYFSTILEVADEFNVHPLLLFAVTGQEQAFVPRHHNRASEIANNPFNVFHSWEDFNTNILESTQIAARTIVNLSQDRPDDKDPIQWINRKYAEDTNWRVGVSSIFKQLERATQ